MTNKSQIARLLMLVVGCVGLTGASLAQDPSGAGRGEAASSNRPTPGSVSAERALAGARGEEDGTAARLDAARAYLAEGVDSPSKLNAAQRHLGALLKRQPANAEALLLAGQIEMLRSKWRAAATYYRRATAAAPSDPTGYLGLGDALTRLGDEEGAARAFAAFRAASGMEPIED
jgi:predicted Zn-dependent protease